jgi:hypothetical protein
MPSVNSKPQICGLGCPAKPAQQAAKNPGGRLGVNTRMLSISKCEPVGTTAFGCLHRCQRQHAGVDSQSGRANAQCTATPRLGQAATAHDVVRRRRAPGAGRRRCGAGLR